MSANTDALRAKAAEIVAIADAIDAGEPPPPPPPPSNTWPTARDCLLGTPTGPTMNPAPGNEQDMAHFNARNALFASHNASLHDGSILFVGDSITEYMPVANASQWAYNMGISSDTCRGVLNRIAGQSVIHRAGAVVLLIGINDLVWEGMHYGVPQAIADVKYMFDLLAPHMTGKWLVLGILPINEGIYPNKTIKNADIDQVNAYLATKFAGSSVVKFLNLKPLLVDGTGNLNPAYTPAGDGVHPSAAGYAVITPAISAALQQMGVQ